ncbi:Lamin-like protein [Linum perenne]
MGYIYAVFVFDKRYYNVLEVNKTSYEVCNEQGFIKNVTRGGRDVVELKEPKPYYFMSGGGYCWGGMKVEVNVVKSFQTAPAPAPQSNAAAAAAAAPLISFIMALAALFASPIFFALF